MFVKAQFSTNIWHVWRVDMLWKCIGCDEDSLELAQKEPKNVGAVWHIFHPKDVEMLSLQ